MKCRARFYEVELCNHTCLKSRFHQFTAGSESSYVTFQRQLEVSIVSLCEYAFDKWTFVKFREICARKQTLNDLHILKV